MTQIALLREENELLRRGQLVSPSGRTNGGIGVGGEVNNRGVGGEPGGKGDPTRWLEEMVPGPESPLAVGSHERRGDSRVIGGTTGIAADVNGAEGAGKLPLLVSHEDGAEAAFPIGQASRDVAVLLRKYEEEVMKGNVQYFNRVGRYRPSFLP